MATTTNTLPHDTYANETTPLWATAGAGQSFVSPSVVVNTVVPSTAGMTTTVSDDVTTASFQFNTIPAGTALNEIEMSGATNGITLLTNGEPTLYTAPGETGVIGDLAITSRQTGGTWVFNNNELSYNGVKQLTGGSNYAQLGENTYTDQYGLSVWNVNSSNKTTTLSDREIYFTTTTPGTVTTQTYDFVSTLVPNQATANPLVRNPNTRTPQPYQDAFFSPYNANSGITTSPTKPYTITVQNTAATISFIGARLQLSSIPDDWIKGSEFPIWFEFTAFDPGIYRYSFINQGAGFGQTTLVGDIRNQAGVLTFEAIGSVSPTTFTVGDFISIIYEWIDKPTGQAKVTIAKNNVVVSSSPTGLTTASDVIPLFASISTVAPGFFFNLNLNWGTVSKVISSFDDWEWTNGLGGLYPTGNTALRPLASGSSPPGFLYNSVYLLGGCSMTSPPISSGVGLTITIAAYKGEKIGSGTLRIFQNGVNLIFTGGVGSAWSSGTITTAVSTGSDTFTFQYLSATDVLSLQRIQISFNSPVDVLDGGMGMNGTVLNIGQGNYYSVPTISMTSSNVNFTKNINLGTNTISNGTFNGTSTGTFSGNITTNSITPISPATSTQVGNLNLSNATISNVGILSTNSITGQGLGTLSVGSTIYMTTQQNISNVGTLSSVNITNSSNITTAQLNGAVSQLDVGLISPTNNFWNVNTITGRGSNFPMLITMCDTINQVSAVATGGIYIQTNFGGFRELMIPLVPTWNRSTTECYTLAGDNYLGTQGYLLAGKSQLVIYDQFLTILSIHTNNVDTPRSFLNTDLILNSPNRLYTYRAYLPGL
jgi:hypothetical protein